MLRCKQGNSTPWLKKNNCLSPGGPLTNQKPSINPYLTLEVVATTQKMVVPLDDDKPLYRKTW